MSSADVRAHPLGVDLEPVERLAHRRAAPPVQRERVRRAAHSACQAPAAALVLLRRRREQRRRGAGARRAHARASVEPTGLRLCGIVEEPPARRLAHLADLGLREQHDVEPRSSPTRPAATPSARAEPRDRGRGRVPGHDRLGEVELRREAARDLEPAGRRARRACPPRRRAAPAARAARALARASSTPTSQPAALRPNVVGTACCSSVRAGHHRVAMRLGEPRARARRRRRARARTSSQRAARDEHRRRVQDVLARRAAVTSARVAADRSRSARTSGSTGLPTPRPARASARVEQLGDAGAAIGRGLGGTTPLRSACASARSASSIASSHASSETASRSSAGHEERRRRSSMREEHRLRARPASGCRSAGRRPPLGDERRALASSSAASTGSVAFAAASSGK